MSSDLWAEWFDDQYELNDRIEKAVNGLSEGKSAGLKVALWSAVIEKAAEELRNAIPDMAMDPLE